MIGYLTKCHQGPKRTCVFFITPCIRLYEISCNVPTVVQEKLFEIALLLFLTCEKYNVGIKRSITSY